MCQLGAAGPKVFPIALGCMGMSGMYGPADEAECIATIHEALDRGITLIDTGDFYGMGQNELLVGRALKGRRDKVFLSVKFGALRAPNGAWLGYDARPSAVKNFLSYSLTRRGHRGSHKSRLCPLYRIIGGGGGNHSQSTFDISYL